MELVFQYLTNGLMVGAVYALISLGIVLIYKSTAVFNFAIGQMVTIGAFVLYTFVAIFGLPLWLSLLLTLAFGGLLGLLIDRTIMRSLVGQPLLAPVLATLALFYFIGGVIAIVWRGFGLSLSPIFAQESIWLGEIAVCPYYLGAFIIAILVFAMLALFFGRMRSGLAMRAVAESHQVAQARGINVGYIFMLTWMMSGVLAFVAATFLGYRLGVTQFLADVGMKAIPVVLLGGLDSIGGVIVAGLIVGVVENLVGGLVASWLAEATPYFILLLVIIIRPEGLFGLKRIERI